MNINIRDYCTEEEVIQLTQDLIKIPSDWNQPYREKGVLDYIAQYLEQQGIIYKKQKVSEYTYNIIASVEGKEEGKTMLLNGHVDTVPSYDMDFPPYEAFIENGYIHGRGAVDMKGAIASMLMTLIVLKRSNYPFVGKVMFTAVVGEEGRSEGTERLVLEHIKADGAIVGEPSAFDYAVGHRGLEWLEIEVNGKIAHSGILEEGINAITKAMKLLARIEEELLPRLALRNNHYTGPSILNVGRISGGTQPSTVADRCVIQIDRRYTPEETHEDVIAEIQDIINKCMAEDPELKASLKIMEENKMDHLVHCPMVTNPTHPLVQILHSNIEKTTSKTPQISTRRGWTDGGLLSHYAQIPTVICGPGDIKYSHSKNEKVAIEQLMQAIEIYTSTAIQFCSSK